MSESQATTIRELIDCSAASRPEVDFLVSPETGRTVTFRALRERSILLSGQLLRAGLERGDKVAFLLDNGLFTAQLFLGSMYGGFVSVPLNVRAGVSQLSYTLNHCDAKIVFVGEEYRGLLNEALADVPRPIQAIPADSDWFEFDSEAEVEAEILPPPEPGDLALLMYTSGSVGQPKAAMHTHRTILAHGKNSVCSHRLTSEDRSLLVLPLYHINAECVTLVPTLLSGGSVVVPHRFAVAKFWEWLDEYRCTWSAVVPTIVSQLLDWQDPLARQHEEAFKRVRFLRSSSAPLAASLQREFLGKFNVLLIQAMGSSEAGNIFSNPLPPGENKIGTPGVPWGFEIRIVDREGRDVAPGEPGEVLVRGEAVMRGYYKDPEGTAAVLDGEGWMHTGDLAYCDQDGYFFVAGRSKELIIKGGMNIAPRQIDEVLESHPSLLEAAVVGVPDRYVGEDLVAFVVPRTGASVEEKDLLEFCESRLGHFKTPTRIHFADDLPKGPSGKVQRLKLLDWAKNTDIDKAANGNGHSALGRPFVATSDIEPAVAESWAELLGWSEIDPHSNFFSLGGTSLMAIQCLSRLRQKLSVALSLREFFENPTINRQAVLVAQRLARSDAPEIRQNCPRRPGMSSPYPLSPGQQRLWFVELSASGAPIFNEAEAARLLGRLDVEALEKALEAMVARHEALRTTIRIIDGQPMAVVHDAWPIRLKQIDLGGLAPDERALQIERLLVEEPSRPYHLDAEPGIRMTLVRLGPREHVLILMMHHIVSDRWSFGVLWRGLSEIYQAFSRGERLSLRPLRVQHGDYAVWRRQHVAEGNFTDDLAWWEGNLRGAPALLELPADRPRPVVCSYRGARRCFRLNAILTERLRDFSKRETISLFNLFTAALKTLIYRYTGTEDIVVGIPLADRELPELQSVIGFLLHNHALRTQLSDNMTFRELLDRVYRGLLDLYTHRDVPFEQVVSRLQPERSPGHAPVFQVAINWRDRNQQLPFIGLNGLTVEPLLAETKTSKIDLTLVVTDGLEDIGLEVEYSTDLFDDDRIGRMFGHYETLLEAITEDPGRRLTELSLLTLAERHRILHEWNDTQMEYPRDKCVHELFEEQARKTPDAVAVVFEGASLSYRELNARANRLAHFLRELGVRPEVRVAICLERGLEMVVAILAVLKAGGAYVPLDPSYPAERLRFMLEDSAPVALLTRDRVARPLPGLATAVPVVAVAQAALWQDQPSGNSERDTIGLKPEHLAYIIYTSGSTGQPKGVMVEHRNVVNLITEQIKSLAIRPGSRILQFGSFSFDSSVIEFFAGLCGGACLFCFARETDVLFGEVKRHAITHAILPSAVLASVPEGSLDSVRVLTVGGDVLTGASANRWGQRRTLINEYGVTEATVCATTYTCGTGEFGNQPIGRPIANTRIYIIDGHGQPVPVGVPGELYIGGAGVARGYLNHPELTAEKFLKDRFVRDPGARVYKTGDLARYLPDGNIEFLGRNDFQVKIRGFRIELGEIEARLAEYPGVREAAVAAREHTPGDKRLVAYYVAAEGKDTLGTEELRSHLSRVLPEYMVPAVYVRLQLLPLTPNGKLDRKALPAPEMDAYATLGYEEPQGEMEKRIAAVWAEVLKLERVGRHDNFFSLGGHSLLAITLIERLRRGGLQVDVRALFATPTVAELAVGIDARAKVVEVPSNRIPLGCEAIMPEMVPLVQLTAEEIERIVSATPGGAANVQDIYPLLPIQEGFLFHHLMGETGDPYVLRTLLNFDNRARLDVYIEALQGVVNRHDVLRTAVVWEGMPEPVQVVWRAARLHVEEVDIGSESGDMAEQLFARFDPRRFRMDLRHAPLLRLYIAHDSAQERWLAVLLRHHLTADHTTLEVMQAEVQAHLVGQAEGLPTPLPFRNVVAQARLGVSAQEYESFFRELLGDVAEPTAPFGLLDVQGDGSGIEEARLVLEEDLAWRLRAQARRLKVSAASLCHLAWARVLASVSRREDVVFGTVLFGRMQGGEGADRALGPLINTLPVRIAIGERGLEESVRRTHTLLADLLRHEHAALTIAQRCSAVPAPAPLFSALLNYRHSPGPAQRRAAEAHPACEGIRVLPGWERTNYPIGLSVNDHGDGFSLDAQTPAWVGPMRVCEYMRTALESLAGTLEANPGQAVRELEVLPAAERDRIVHDWNDTQAEYPRDKCVHDLFEEQARKTPDAVGVVFEKASLSYGELNAQANRVAHYLRELGVQPDARVAICLERSLEMVVAILAVLKAGGAYVPLDPELPAERLDFMLEDSSPLALLTQGHLAVRFAESNRTLPVLDMANPAPAWGDRPVRDPGTDSIGLRPHHLAYVIYTSGSTGNPKGVMIEHRSLVNAFLWRKVAYGLDRHDIVLQNAPFSFDVSAWEFFVPLLVGARVVMLRPHGHRDPDYVCETIRRYRVTTANFVPSMLQAILDHAAEAEFPSLVRVLSGGEAMPAGLVRRFHERFPGVSLYNLYGPTEATIDVTAWPCPPDAPPVIPIGRPIANTQIYILDTYMQPVPVGVAGELYIGGECLARGYLNRSELTAEKFIPDPFRNDPGARLYKTGDLARYLADGNIEFLGRNDFQVKIRGFRIELGEIEARLAAHAAVREAVIVARENTPGDKRLVAYYVAAGDQEAPGAEELRSYLADALPEYMIPAAYVRLEHLPLTPNGKLDRKALPAPEMDAYATRGYEEPQGEMERRIAALWAEVLKLERVGRHDNFFELGGHSLLATRLVSQFRRVLGVDAPLRWLFEEPTVAGFAQYFEEPHASPALAFAGSAGIEEGEL